MGDAVRRVHWFTGCTSALVLVLGFVGSARAQLEMPDPSMIHGKALPARDLATGTITVRVVREAIGNDIPGRQVTLTVGGVGRTAMTDGMGRAEFSGLPVGGEGRAQATIDGEQLTSDPLAVPESGGLRVILVAGLAKAAERRKQEEADAAAAPPVKGVVVLGGNSRIVFEYPDDLMRVYYLLEIVNNARTRVDIGGPLVIDLPREAAGAFALDGSTTQANIAGTRVTVTGPFNSGITSLRIGFQIPFSTSSMTLTQPWPAALEQVTVASQKVGSLAISSPQFSTVGDVKAEDGTSFILASGNALPAGGVLSVQIAGLPVHSTTPRNVALALAVAIGVMGVWLSWPRGSSATEVHARLVSRRDSLLGELAQVEERLRRGSGESPKDLARKQRLVAELEQIYGELDEAAPRGGGTGVAA